MNVALIPTADKVLLPLQKMRWENIKQFKSTPKIVLTLALFPRNLQFERKLTSLAYVLPLCHLPPAS